MAHSSTGLHISHALQSAPDLKAINVQLQALAALDAQVRNALPPGLHDQVRICGRQEKAFVLAVRSSAVAARIRMMTPRLLRALADQCPAGTDLKIVVEIAGLRPRGGANGRRLGSAAMKSLGALAASLPDSPLRRAIDNLVMGQSRSDGEDEALEDEKGRDQGSDE